MRASLTRKILCALFGKSSSSLPKPISDPKSWLSLVCLPNCKLPGDVTKQGQGFSSEESIYFCGNSLGLQPKAVSKYIEAQLDTWSGIGVHGHFTPLEESPLVPWQLMAETAAEQSARIVGAKPEEVAIMNTLTVNLHMLMASFYKPEGQRTKILLEWKAFPSDHYAIESQLQVRGMKPKEHMILIEPDNDHIISTEKILRAIDEHADEIALILLPGIQYYSGQFFDMLTITAHAKSKGLTIGWDLAHAAGNVPVKLHDWDVDFAAWCTYKYQNAGPGAIAGCFVHEKHGKVEFGDDGQPIFRPRLTGWYGGDRAVRFKMDNSECSCFLDADGSELTNEENSDRFPAQAASSALTRRPST